MKKYVRAIMLMALLGISTANLEAQSKKTVKKRTGAKTTAAKKAVVERFTPTAFGTATSISDIADVKETSAEYQSLKNLIETNGVTLVYEDSSFRPREPLRRGDFIVSFNSALDVIKRAATAGGSSTPFITTPEANESGITQVSDIKDLKESSLYYPAAQSLIEQYGIYAPFAKARTLNAGATMPEGEVYQILKETLGYNSPGSNPYATAMTRSKFAMVLNNALNLKLTQVNAMLGAATDSLDNVRMQQETMLKQQDRMRKDSLAKQAELSRLDSLKRNGETWSKLSDREKRKQLKNQKTK